MPQPKFNFEKILDNISAQKCALVIGPELMQFEGKPMNMYLRDKLYKQYEGDVKHYYQNDGLFLFRSKNDSVKYDVALSLRKECKNLPNTAGFDEGILKAIAQLPFHLIISINPDTFLSDTFYKYGVRHRFAHFRKGEKPNTEVAVPTREEPLIYNIAGSVLEDESLILDYEDLFSLISSSLGAASLPNGLKTTLRDIRTYVFVGFPFEKWYTQVMLRIVCINYTYTNYADPHKISPDTNTFLTNEFNFEFWDNKDDDFLSAFLKTAAEYKDTTSGNTERPFLRELLKDPLAPDEVSIIREIKNGNYDKAIEHLIAFAKGNAAHENEAVQISGRYQYLMQNQTKIDSRDYLTNLNQISDAIITLARQIATSK